MAVIEKRRGEEAFVNEKREESGVTLFMHSRKKRHHSQEPSATGPIISGGIELLINQFNQSRIYLWQEIL